VDYGAISPEELVIACVETGDPAAWAEFIRRFHPLIAGVTIRISRRWGQFSREVVDDLVQDVYLKLCSEGLVRLRNFAPRHRDAMYGFIKTFTANLVHDHFKALESLKRGGGSTTVSIDLAEGGPQIQSTDAGSESMQRKVLIGEIDSFLKTAELGPNAERDRRIFWMYYRVGLTASGIATLPGIGLSTKGVESTIGRLTRIVRSRLSDRARHMESSGGPDEGMLPAESL
jgi:RNA polymerase sigma-70 factor (ECF subfamily)